MIYTDMEHLDRYRGICPQLDTAIDYLLENGLELLVPGRNEVDGEDVFVNRFHYTTMPQEEAAFEAHEFYADIHLLAEGREYIGVTPIERLTVTRWIGRPTTSSATGRWRRKSPWSRARC